MSENDPATLVQQALDRMTPNLGCSRYEPGSRKWVLTVDGEQVDGLLEQDAVGLMTLRNLAPAVLGEVERLERENAQLRAAVDDLQTDWEHVVASTNTTLVTLEEENAELRAQLAAVGRVLTEHESDVRVKPTEWEKGWRAGLSEVIHDVRAALGGTP